MIYCYLIIFAFLLLMKIAILNILYLMITYRKILCIIAYMLPSSSAHAPNHFGYEFFILLVQVVIYQIISINFTILVAFFF